ncbi:MAG: DUF756 domain-containing protein [Sphingobacterium sp.]|uniref:phospholipase domain-containing protein n=1 Tax=Sphingobacterium sp. TaxID=341027 RepID=UPI0028458699|nr:phospholipase domain-containing protein [Sphingobacterium sp.]MDR3011056.1 DUF756 domain-containing protein [Sphingobacterium sp.]
MINRKVVALGALLPKEQVFRINMQSLTETFGQRSLNAAFNVYTGPTYKRGVMPWPFAVLAGDTVSFDWNLGDFENLQYDFSVYGPNGFYRTFKGRGQEPEPEVHISYEKNNEGKATGRLKINCYNPAKSSLQLDVVDNAYSSFEEKG